MGVVWLEHERLLVGGDGFVEAAGFEVVSPSITKELTVRVGVGVGMKGGQISPCAKARTTATRATTTSKSAMMK